MFWHRHVLRSRFGSLRCFPKLRHNKHAAEQQQSDTCCVHSVQARLRNKLTWLVRLYFCARDSSGRFRHRVGWICVAAAPLLHHQSHAICAWYGVVSRRDRRNVEQICAVSTDWWTKDKKRFDKRIRKNVHLLVTQGYRTGLDHSVQASCYFASVPDSDNE